MNVNASQFTPCSECGRRVIRKPAELCSRCSARAMVPERKMQSEAGRAAQAKWERIRGHRIKAIDALVVAVAVFTIACAGAESPLAPKPAVPCTPGTADTAVVIVVNGVPYKEVVQCGDGRKK